MFLKEHCIFYEFVKAFYIIIIFFGNTEYNMDISEEDNNCVFFSNKNKFKKIITECCFGIVMTGIIVITLKCL